MRPISVALLVLFTAFTGSSWARNTAAPLVDGDCAEYADLGAASHAITEGVVLYEYQDRDYVWLCYTLPEESFGSLDLRVESEALTEPLNLHVSAQLGEWAADHPEQVPPNAQSSQWWNHRGWTAHWIRFNGMDADASPAKPRFRLGGARELQLSRHRFGYGEWHLLFNIEGVRMSDKTLGRVRFPAVGSYQVRFLPRD